MFDASTALDQVPACTRLYIGGLYTLRRKAALHNAGISHIISVLRGPLAPELFEKCEHLQVEVDDVDDEDLLQHFGECIGFIEKATTAGGNVLVHCAMGKSRSATVCIAYMMFKNRGLDPDTALQELREVRSVVEPNEGFWKQLMLYHSMGCPLDIQERPEYQRWLYQREVELSNACGRAPELIKFSDELQLSNAADVSLEYRCRKCRFTLATSAHVLPHKNKSRGTDLSSSTEPISSLEPAKTDPSCAHIFLDPLSWMRDELEQGKVEGRLECPNAKCKTNVGRYAWQGSRCSCGEWVVPGISLQRARVDENKPRAAIVPRLPPNKI